MSLDMPYAWSAASDTGRVREHNEDHMGIDAQAGLFILADGMGGHQGGEVASKIAVESAMRHLQAAGAALDPGGIDDETGLLRASLALREAVMAANRAIRQEAERQPRLQGMGTTLIIAWFHQDRLSIAHVGDSRLYRHRQGRLAQLTCDHTMRQELIDRGLATDAEAGALIGRNIVTRALGLEQAPAVDLLEESTLPGDTFLLCTDGLYDMVEDPAIAHALASASDLPSCAARLIDLANAGGGKDNVSVILIRPGVTTAQPCKSPWHQRLRQRWRRRA